MVSLQFRQYTFNRSCIRSAKQGLRRNVYLKSQEGEASTNQIEEAYKLLGVSKNADFNNIMSAKKRQISKCRGNQGEMDKVEAAYDLILMQSMKNRLSGDSNVPTSVRFADVVNMRPKVAARADGLELPSIGGMQLKIKRESPDQVKIFSIVYGALVTWAIVGAVIEPGILKQVDSAGTQLSLGFLAALYFSRKNKNLNFGKSAAILGIGAIVGLLGGSLLESILHVDIAPIGSFQSPGVVIGSGVLVGLWAALCFIE